VPHRRHQRQRVPKARAWGPREGFTYRVVPRAQRFLEDDDDMMKMCLTRKKLLEHANASSGAAAHPAHASPAQALPLPPSSPSWLTQTFNRTRLGARGGRADSELLFLSPSTACCKHARMLGSQPWRRLCAEPAPEPEHALSLCAGAAAAPPARRAPDGGAPAGLASAPSHSLYGARRSGSLAVGSLPRFSGWQGGGTPSSPTGGGGAGADGAAENDDSEESIEAVENLLESYFMQIDASYDRLVSIGAPFRPSS